MRKKIILSAGGTGGHLFPAQAVAADLAPHADVIFMAGGLEGNSFFERMTYPYYEIEATPLQFSKPWKLPLQARRLGHGIAQAKRLLEHLNPSCVVGFGSFYALPVLLAAQWKGIPLILHEQNALPGRVNRLFAPFAAVTAITFSETAHYLRGKTQCVDFPLRSFPPQDPWSYFGWQPGQKTLLVCGGSQGAASLNRCVMRALPFLKEYRIIHSIGSKGDVATMEEAYRKAGICACVKTFEPRMDLAMHVADCAFCRAGAATVCELRAYGTPAILVPYPQARDNHQEYNAAHFVKIGGGIRLHDRDLDEKAFLMALSRIDQRQARESLLCWHPSHATVSLTKLLLEYL